MKNLKKKIKSELGLFFESFIMGIVKLGIIVLLFIGFLYAEIQLIIFLEKYSGLISKLKNELNSSELYRLFLLFIPFIITKLIANRIIFLHIKKLKDTKKDIF